MTTIGDNLEDIYELSPLQQGMLFHTQYAPESGVYLEQVHCTLHGALQIPAFKSAWQRVIRQHPVLRTAVYWEDLESGVQVVYSEAELPWQQLDWREFAETEQLERFQRYLQSDRARGLDLTTAPIMRLTLIQTADNAFYLLWSYHHLLLDGWSLFLVLSEVFACYEAALHNREAVLEYRRPYKDYIAWLQAQSLTQAERFWRETLADFTEPTPFGVGRERGELPDGPQIYAGQRQRFSTETTEALRTLARQHQLTLNTLVQGAWAVLLHRYSGREDVVFGTVVSGRPATLPGVEAMVGLFINTLPVRVRVDHTIPLITWLQRLQEQQAELRQHEYSPLALVQGWSGIPGGTPLFESIIVFENYPVNTSQAEWSGSLEIGPFLAIERTNYPLTLAVAPASDLSFQLNYDSRRFDSSTVERMLHHLSNLLESMLADPLQRVDELTLLSDLERQQILVRWNETAIEYATISDNLPQGFERQVERSPQAIALVDKEERLTYHELNQRANQLARFLQGLGVKLGVPVGICLERSLALVISLLGILKAGGAYVPLDPNLPRERLLTMVNDAQMPVVLTQESLRPLLPAQEGLRILCLDSEGPAIARESTENLRLQIAPDHLAYILYTSGSTGIPKGVMIQHAAACNHMEWMKTRFAFTDHDKVLQKTPVGFDASVWEFFAPLLAGSQIVLARPGGHMDSRYLIECIREYEISIIQVVPSLLHLLLEEPTWEDSTSLRLVFCGGEDLPIELQHRFAARSQAILCNLYGPTEATIDTLYWICEAGSTRQKVPIGHPIANVEAYLLDQYLRPVPIGVTGELFLSGKALGLGYLKRPDLTAERFLPHPFRSESGERLYRTGDLARYGEDGSIEFLGRLDEQVKLRGYRIELQEIEAVLQQQPSVLQAAVVVRVDSSGDQFLAAYIVPREGTTMTLSALRSALQAKLPLYMVPSTFMRLDALPLTASGKVNRRALPEPEASSLPIADRTDAIPHSELEQTIAGIWQETLHVQHVGLHDNFFDLGGHSLLLIRVQATLRASLNRDIPLIDLFQYTTISSLAKHLGQPEQEEPSLQQSYDRAARRTATRRPRRSGKSALPQETLEEGVDDE